MPKLPRDAPALKDKLVHNGIMHVHRQTVGSRDNDVIRWTHILGPNLTKLCGSNDTCLYISIHQLWSEYVGSRAREETEP